MDLLDDWIKSKGLPEAEWAPDGNSVTIDGDVYSIDQFGKENERLAKLIKTRVLVHVFLVCIKSYCHNFRVPYLVLKTRQ